MVFFSRGNGVAINGTELAVARSSDGGQTWKPTFFALENGQSKFNDKPYIAVDDNPANPHRNTIYVAWDRFVGSPSGSNGVLVSHSTDYGATWDRRNLPFGIIRANVKSRGKAGAAAEAVIRQCQR